MTLDNKAGRDRPKPFLEHLEELRRTLIGSVVALALGMAIALPLTPRLFQLLRAPLAQVTDHPEQFLRSLEITGGFAIALQMIFWTGLLFSAPVIILLIVRFVFPGLTRPERRAVLGASGFGLILFSGGVVLGYLITLPVALRVMLGLHQWLGIQAEWTATSYVSFAVQLLLAFGLAFELPVVLMILGYLGLVSSALLLRFWRQAVVGILILAMVLTPGPDIFSQVVMAVPMLLLYGFCIVSIRLFERRRGQA